MGFTQDAAQLGTFLASEAASSLPIRNAIFHSFNPHGSAPEQLLQGVDTRGEIGRVLRNVDKPLPDPNNIQTPSEEAWLQYLELPTANKFIKPTDERPSFAQNPDAEYFEIEGFWDQLLSRDSVILHDGQEVSFPEDFDEEEKLRFLKALAESAGGKLVINGDQTGGFDRSPALEAMRNFTLSIGEDEEGEFISYFDVWDMNQPLEGLIGKPFELYGRRRLNRENDD